MNDYDPNYVPKKSFALVGQKAIIINKDSKILVLQRSEKIGGGGKWSLPGGALEFSENPYESIKREIREEAQLEVTGMKPFHIKSYVTNDKDFVVIIGYQCKVLSESVVLNWEHTDFKWLEKKEVLSLDLTDDARFFVQHFDI